MIPTVPSEHKRPPIFLLAAILLAGLFARSWGIWEYQFSPDEMLFLIIAKGETLGEVWRRGLAELHPPLAHFIRHYLLLLPDGPFIQRLFSVAAGMAAILGIYQFGRALRGQWAGVFCAGCMALLPVAVSASMTIRNYAFFMAFLAWALVFFARYLHRRQRHDLIIFISLMVLAAATHFSGFIAAAICGLCAAFWLLREKRTRELAFLCFSYTPLLLLALSFYPYYLTADSPIPTWNRFLAGTDPAISHTAGLSTGLLTYFIPFLHLLRHYNIGGAGILSSVVLTAAIGLMALHTFGLYRMRTSPYAFSLVLTAWLVALAAAGSGFYAFAGTRHNYYFLPFFILPFWYALEVPINKLLFKRYAIHTAAALVCLMAVGLKASHIYEWYGEEFSLKHADYEAGQAYLLAHVQPGDAIVTGRIAAYFYLLYSKDAGKTPYASYADFPYFNDTLLLAPYDPPTIPYTDSQPFRKSLQERLITKPVMPAAGNVWFVMYGAKNAEIWHLMECRALQSDIKNFLSRENVVVFSIKRAALTAFLQNTTAWEKCYAGYKPLITAQMFPAVLRP